MSTKAVSGGKTPQVDQVGYKLPILVGALIMVVAGSGALALHLANLPFEPEELSRLFRVSAFVGVTGLAAIGLGIYIFRTLRSGKVFYKQGARDYGFLILQLAPGAILSGLGNTLTPEFGWISLGLGTALSVLFLRRTGDPVT